MQTKKSDQSVIVYDDALISQIDESLFDTQRWSEAEFAEGRGRGQVLFIEHNRQQWALRHYCRGGLMRHLSTDRYCWAGLEGSRPFREWTLLDQLFRSELPVPRPVAARIKRRGVFYTGDLITVRIPDVRTLSNCLSAASLSADTWHSVGGTIARFHSAGVCHADLNAHNIQLDSQNRVYLLDFDRGRIMNAPGNWMQGNLDRLHRSLTKLRDQGLVRFRDVEWSGLVEGYRQGLSVEKQ